MGERGALGRCIEQVAARLASAGSGAGGEFARALAAVDAGASEHRPAGGGPPLAVLRHWPEALAGAAVVDPAIAGALGELSSELCWRQNPNYVRRPPDPRFLTGYGYAAIAGPGGLVPAGIAFGVLLLAPGIFYPAHAHPAEEVYLVLDRASRWWREGAAWREGIGGAAIHHPPHLAHAMQAGEEPLLALYLWRGDIATPAALTVG